MEQPAERGVEKTTSDGPKNSGQITKAYPRRPLHLVCDNYATNLLKCRQEIGSAAMIFQAPIGFAPTPPVASPG